MLFQINEILFVQLFLSCLKFFLLRIIGRQSGQPLVTFRGHQSFVNDCCWSHDELFVISCSSDGTVKIWNVAQGDCLTTFRPGMESVFEATVNNIVLHPVNDEIFVCNRSQEISLFQFNGKVS